MNVFDYPVHTPTGTIYALACQLEPYVNMTDEELEAEINKPFIDPFAFAVYRKRRYL